MHFDLRYALTGRHTYPLQRHAQRNIGIDFDEVLFWTNKSWLEVFKERTGYPANWDGIKNWDFSPAVPRELYPELMACRTPAIYERCWPAPDALDAVRELHAQGHFLICITYDTPEFVAVKARLLRWFYPMLADRLVVAKNKWNAARFDLLVDDAAHNNPSYLVARPWNEADAHKWGDRCLADLRELPKRFGCC